MEKELTHVIPNVFVSSEAFVLDGGGMYMHPAVDRINEILPLFNPEVSRHAQVTQMLEQHREDVIRLMQGELSIAQTKTIANSSSRNLQ